MRGRPTWPKPGYVYLFWPSGAGLIGKERRPTKIGFCNLRHGESGNETVLRRYYDIQRHHWQGLVYRFSKTLLSANDAEYEIHCKYEKYRMQGEWFNLTPKQIQNIMKYLNSQTEW